MDLQHSESSVPPGERRPHPARKATIAQLQKRRKRGGRQTRMNREQVVYAHSRGKQSSAHPGAADVVARGATGHPESRDSLPAGEGDLRGYPVQ